MVESEEEEGLRCEHCSHPNWPGDRKDAEWSTCDGQCQHFGGETRELVEDGIWRDMQARGRTVRRRKLDSQPHVLCDICWDDSENWYIPNTQLGL